MTVKKLFILLAAFLVLPTLARAENDLLRGADLAYGEYLAGECTACHKSHSSNENIPSIVGMEAEAFAAIMHEYRNKSLNNPTMQTIAARLSDDEIASLAVYFAAQSRD